MQMDSFKLIGQGATDTFFFGVEVSVVDVCVRARMCVRACAYFCVHAFACVCACVCVFVRACVHT